MKKWILVAALALFGVAAVYASPAPVPDKPQKKEKVKIIRISGTVKDEAGKALSGVMIEIKDEKAGYITDKAGEFSGTALTNSVLVVSLDGYEKQEIPVDGRYEINIVLKKEVKKETDK